MLDVRSIFLTQRVDSMKRIYNTHDEMIEKIIGNFTKEGQTVLEVSDVIPVIKDNAGGFFTGIDGYVDITTDKEKLRLVEVDTINGATFDRFILAPADQDVCDVFFENFAYNTADRIIKDSVYILVKDLRDEYIKQTLLDRRIYVDNMTFNQITIRVQKAFLETYHRMWSI